MQQREQLNHRGIGTVRARGQGEAVGADTAPVARAMDAGEVEPVAVHHPIQQPPGKHGEIGWCLRHARRGAQAAIFTFIVP